MAPQQPLSSVVKLMFGGDVMLGRLVKAAILAYGPDYPLAPIADLLRNADLTIVNLECAITASEKLWSGEPKAFYFGAPPAAVTTLVNAGVDMVSLANNHVLDFDVIGLRETLDTLRQHGICFAGAGENSDAAHTPAAIERSGIRFGMAAFCDHQSDFAAAKTRPGIAYIDLDNESAAIQTLEIALKSLSPHVDWPILSLHWGPNMVFHPSTAFRRIAHGAIDMGWKIIFGHSAHVFHGIEIYRGYPILYAAGDLVDDYFVDPHFNNDHQLVIEITVEKNSWSSIFLHPVVITRCQARPASHQQHVLIAERMIQACNLLGTHVHRQNGSLWIAAKGP